MARNFKIHWFLCFSIIILSNNSLSRSSYNITPSAINFHNDFEDPEEQELQGYYWYPQSSKMINVSTTSEFSYSGENSLVIESTGGIPTTSLNIPLNLDFENNKFFSLYLYVIGNHRSILRINLEDEIGNRLSLDYGQFYFGWEPYPIFDTGIGSDTNSWYHFSQDLSVDVDLALSIGNPFFENGEFSPWSILDIYIFQPIPGVVSVIFIDDLIFADSPPAEIIFSGNTNISKYEDRIIDFVPFNGKELLSSSSLVLPIDILSVRVLAGTSVVLMVVILILLKRKT